MEKCAKIREDAVPSVIHPEKMKKGTTDNATRARCTCPVTGCPSRRLRARFGNCRKEYSGVTYHGFPRNPAQRRLWLLLLFGANAAGEPRHDPGAAKVCSLHFCQRDLIRLGPTTFVRYGSLPVQREPEQLQQVLEEQIQKLLADSVLQELIKEEKAHKSAVRCARRRNRIHYRVGQVLGGLVPGQVDTYYRPPATEPDKVWRRSRHPDSQRKRQLRAVRSTVSGKMAAVAPVDSGQTAANAPPQQKRRTEAAGTRSGDVPGTESVPALDDGTGAVPAGPEVSGRRDREHTPPPSGNGSGTPVMSPHHLRIGACVSLKHGGAGRSWESNLSEWPSPRLPSSALVDYLTEAVRLHRQIARLGCQLSGVQEQILPGTGPGTSGPVRGGKAETSVGAPQDKTNSTFTKENLASGREDPPAKSTTSSSAENDVKKDNSGCSETKREESLSKSETASNVSTTRRSVSHCLLTLHRPSADELLRPATVLPSNALLQMPPPLLVWRDYAGLQLQVQRLQAALLQQQLQLQRQLQQLKLMRLQRYRDSEQLRKIRRWQIRQEKSVREESKADQTKSAHGRALAKLAVWRRRALKAERQLQREKPELKRAAALAAGLEARFTPAQICCMQGKKVKGWTEEDIRRGIELRTRASKKGYEYLRRVWQLPAPGVLSLRQGAQRFPALQPLYRKMVLDNMKKVPLKKTCMCPVRKQITEPGLKKRWVDEPASPPRRVKRRRSLTSSTPGAEKPSVNSGSGNIEPQARDMPLAVAERSSVLELTVPSPASAGTARRLVSASRAPQPLVSATSGRYGTERHRQRLKVAAPAPRASVCRRFVDDDLVPWPIRDDDAIMFVDRGRVVVARESTAAEKVYVASPEVT